MRPTHRPVEDGVATDLAGESTYGSYLRLDLLLAAQQPVTDHHDEMLFVVQHQVTELWLKQLVHELRSAIALIDADELAHALKRLARVKAVQRQMFEQWGVLETLTPVEYLQFRDALGKASGFQSAQYRTVEFLLGNKTPAMVKVFDHEPETQAQLAADLAAPSLYDAFLAHLARQGHDVPAAVLERDLTQPYEPHPGVVEVFRRVYADPERHWEVYETCEELVDVEEGFHLWRFRHLKTVQRIIGHKRGTGGSSGTSFLQRALELTFFPELQDVRTAL
ncbi:tryptophan 2,3-dioxygenase [Aeromicrobium sp.]|uniref:tryptophan 2,3-dioxygenase n=1 Tax=Aeromicrobium sp. TaxID=1871063 RepID=UPI0010D80577|nr:MAG: tryptophan 2,3-dioxygenase [Actinomycetales bacterium]